MMFAFAQRNSSLSNHRIKLSLVTATALLALGTSTIACGSKDKASAATADPVKVPVATLLSDYKSNEVAGDQHYKDKILEVTGRLDNIATDYVTVGTGAVLEIPEVQAFVTDDAKKQLASLKSGQTVTIRGRGDGHFNNVILRDVSIVSSGPAPAASAAAATPGVGDRLTYEAPRSLDGLLARAAPRRLGEVHGQGGRYCEARSSPPPSSPKTSSCCSMLATAARSRPPAGPERLTPVKVGQHAAFKCDLGIGGMDDRGVTMMDPCALAKR